MKQPLVSVIIPCYNQAAYLSEALDSVISQTYTNWECIVINDGSSDNTETVAKNYAAKDDRIKYIFQENQGVSIARNNAIKQSNGEYILPLDADNSIEVTYIEKTVKILIENDDIKIVYTKIRLFGDEHRIWDLPDFDYDYFVFVNIVDCTALYRREDYDKTNGYNPNMKKGYEDWDFWLGFIKLNDKVYCIPEVLFNYRVLVASRNSSITESDKKELYRQIYENHPDIYKKYTLEFDRDIIYYKHVEKDYYSQQDYVQNLERQLQSVQNSKTYRLGRLILKPFKWLQK